MRFRESCVRVGGCGRCAGGWAVRVLWAATAVLASAA